MSIVRRCINLKMVKNKEVKIETENGNWVCDKKVCEKDKKKKVNFTEEEI